ncbi:sugar phosphate isomerase/epimerase family protein [Cryobacterium sp. PH29-G1]|uniref:sugar phosphate isomerase/epimerase family protein n=1 Tax=Cryobacterium sp. PH29-G1 TaxID=3046211 RepID=UPI0024BB127B|nr:sugar phosphate isomerase/epimerase family protein [Cryobacterium sp. PH29-G1]
MKFSVYTLSLPTHTPAAGAQLVSRLGFGAIEWRYAPLSTGTVSFTGNNRCTIDPAHDTPATVRALGAASSLETVGLAPYLEVGDIDGFERVARFAAEAGVSGIRLRSPSVDDRGFATLFAEGRAYFEQVERVSLRYGVRGLLEMHQRSLCASATMAERLVHGLDPAAIGVIYDVGNLVVEGYEDPRVGLGVLGPYLAHVHLKNAAWRSVAGEWEYYWAPLDAGMLDIRSFLQLLETTGYAGWVSLEDLSTDRPCDETLAHNARLLREWGFLAAAN